MHYKYVQIYDYIIEINFICAKYLSSLKNKFLEAKRGIIGWKLKVDL